MSEATSTARKLPAWALLAGVTALAVGTRVLIAVAERSGSFGRTTELTSGSVAAVVLAAAAGAYVGRRWINRPSGLLLGMAFAGLAALLLAGTTNIAVGLGLGVLVSGAVLWLRNPWRIGAAAGMAVVAGVVSFLFAPGESAVVWGSLAGVLTFLIYGYRIPRREGRGLKTWIAFAGRTAAIMLALALLVWWGLLAPVRTTIAKVQTSGGYVGFRKLPTGPLRTMRKQLEQLGLVPIRVMAVAMSGQEDGFVAGLGRLTMLEDLEIAEGSLDARALAGLARAPALRSLRLSRCQVAPDAWAALAQSPGLSRLDLSQTTLGDDGLTQLAAISTLTTLSLEGSRATVAGLAAFRNHSGLSTLRWSGPGASVEFLGALGSLPSVTDFEVSNWEPSPPAHNATPAVSPLREIGNSPELMAVRSAPNLKRLQVHVPLDEDLRRALIRETPNVLQLEMTRAGTFHPDPADPEGPLVQVDLSYSGVIADLRLLLRPELRCVDVSGCSLQFGDLAHFATLPSLETLVLDRAMLPPNSLEELTGAPRLAALSLRMVAVPAWAQTLSAARFPQMTALRELDLAYNGIVDADLTALGPLPNLRSLNLQGNPLTDAGLKRLSGMSALELLDLRETGVSAPGVQTLQTKLPKVEIRWDEK